jgi:hypothetical protein
MVIKAHDSSSLYFSLEEPEKFWVSCCNTEILIQSDQHPIVKFNHLAFQISVHFQLRIDPAVFQNCSGTPHHFLEDARLESENVER